MEAAAERRLVVVLSVFVRTSWTERVSDSIAWDERFTVQIIVPLKIDAEYYSPEEEQVKLLSSSEAS